MINYNIWLYSEKFFIIDIDKIMINLKIKKEHLELVEKIPKGNIYL